MKESSHYSGDRGHPTTTKWRLDRIGFHLCFYMSIMQPLQKEYVCPVGGLLAFCGWRAIFHLSSAQMAPHPPLQKTQCFATFLPFRPSASSFFWLFLFSDLPSSSLLFSSLTLPTSAFPSVHIVGSLTSKLPSIIYLSLSTKSKQENLYTSLQMLHNVTHAHALAHTHKHTSTHTHPKKNNARVSTCTSCTNEGFDETYHIYMEKSQVLPQWVAFMVIAWGWIGRSWELHGTSTP